MNPRLAVRFAMGGLFLLFLAMGWCGRPVHRGVSEESDLSETLATPVPEVPAEDPLPPVVEPELELVELPPVNRFRPARKPMGFTGQKKIPEKKEDPPDPAPYLLLERPPPSVMTGTDHTPPPPPVPPEPPPPPQETGVPTAPPPELPPCPPLPAPFFGPEAPPAICRDRVGEEVFLRSYLETHLPVTEVHQRLSYCGSFSPLRSECFFRGYLATHLTGDEAEEKIAARFGRPAPEPEPEPVPAPAVPEEEKEEPPVPAVTGLTEEERVMAEVAWSFFASHAAPNTGLVETLSGYRVGTVWDLGSMIAGLVSAWQLGVLEEAAYRKRRDRILDWMEGMPLYNGELPNHTYRFDTGTFANRNGEPATEGYGWSTVDLGRYLIWLKILAVHDPPVADRITRLVSRFRFDRAVSGGALTDVVHLGRARERKITEGAFVYMGYARKGYQLWKVPGLPPDPIADRLVFRDTPHGPVPGDRENRERLTTEPVGLMAAEIGLRLPPWQVLAEAFSRSVLRYLSDTGKAWIPGEESVDQAPWFVYTAVSAFGSPFTCRDIRGVPHPDLANQSLKAAFLLEAVFGLSALRPHRDSLAQRLSTTRGFAGAFYLNGRENRVLNLNTNGIILETLWYRQRGNRPFLEGVDIQEDTEEKRPLSSSSSS